jgi:6-pyruvoyltetrahydropterin/6-carboxytetrahydropterin synthase
MYEIVEHYGFAATHELQGLSSTHPCTGVHLHQWSVEVVLVASRLMSTDGPSELVALEPLRRYVMNELEGRHLNDVVPGEPSSARVARHLVGWCGQHLSGYAAAALHTVTVSAGRSTVGRCTVIRPQDGVR